MSNFTLTACPHCHSLNRLRTDLSDQKGAVCGKCGNTIKLHALVSEVSAQDMKRIIAKADKPVIVDFWASWCGPCRVYGPEFEKASLENRDAIFLKVNTEKDPQIGQELGVRGIPTTIVFKQGKEYRRQSGALPKDMIKQLIA